MNHRWVKIIVAVALVASLGVAGGCKRTIEVQTGTRTVDAQGNVISENVTTVSVPPETASAYRVVTITQPDTSTVEVASNYQAAQQAIVSGNMALAKQLLGKVVAKDPTYRSAKKQLDTIQAGRKPTPDTSVPSTPATSTTKPPSSTTPTASAGGLAKWIPDAISGYTAQKAAIDPLSVSRQYAPSAGSAAALTIYAEQFRSSAEAKQALAAQVKQRYTHNQSSQTINGRTVYFGTTSGFAAAGFTNGAVMVAVEAGPVQGSEADLKPGLAAAVKQLP